jgi:cysteine desulfurase
MKSKRLEKKVTIEARRKVYLDYASLTPTDTRVMKEVERVSTIEYANPSSIHTAGVAAKKILEQSRTTVADFLHAHTDEIFFTASGTEANNIAIRGVVEAAKIEALRESAVRPHGHIHIVVSEIEHTSVLETVKALAAANLGKEIKMEIEIDFIPICSDGRIDLDALKKLLRPETILVSIMLVNNDIGTIQPIRQAAKIVRDFSKATREMGQKMKRPILFHTDACQAPLYLDINVETLGVDLLTLDSNKVYGPRGVGVLYKKRSVKIGDHADHADIVPIMTGGGHESGVRPGTENIPAIAGFAKALEIAAAERVSETKRLLTLRNYFVEELKRLVPGIILNGSYVESERLVNNINVTFPRKQKNGIDPDRDLDFDHEFFLLELDVRGIALSTKSACLRDEDESYVVRALRNARDREVDGGSSGREQSSAQAIRFSLGRKTAKKDIDYTLGMIDEILMK